ncbi:MAG: DUF3343 domain-containing protein [Lachnospiraceae bacterium]|nr:DUF3343 domain-containing protein [Lachnospiraceae bacterium]
MEIKNLIMLTSITYAMKAKDILIRNGIRSDIVRTPKHNSPTGCGYSLYVPKKFNEAISIIRSSGIKILGTVNEGDSA